MQYNFSNITSSSKTSFQKFRPCELGHIKIELINGKMIWSQLYIKIFETTRDNNKKTATKMTGTLLNIWMLCITIEHKNSYTAKIFYYPCKIFFIIFLWKSFMTNFICEILYNYCKLVTLSTLRMVNHAH